jgi:hypothetical protein
MPASRNSLWILVNDLGWRTLPVIVFMRLIIWSSRTVLCQIVTVWTMVSIGKFCPDCKRTLLNTVVKIGSYDGCTVRRGTTWNRVGRLIILAWTREDWTPRDFATNASFWVTLTLWFVRTGAHSGNLALMSASLRAVSSAFISAPPHHWQCRVGSIEPSGNVWFSFQSTEQTI